MQRYKILWVDDEIDLLKPHILFLEQKNYKIEIFSDPFSLIEYINIHNDFDLVLVDENMPGKTGISLISDIKKDYNSIPIIMITKNEEENIMEEAIGSMINDYLIKPLNPNQLLISIKKVLQNTSIIEKKLSSDFLSSFNSISNKINQNDNFKDWIETYKSIIDWEVKFENNTGTEYQNILIDLKKDANKNFSLFIIKNYESWVQGKSEGPILSHKLLKNKIFHHLNQKPIFFIIIDNLRLDQYKSIENYLSKDFFLDENEPYFSIIPTTTEYSRNSIFSGLNPLEMSEIETDLWLDKKDGYNNNEFEFLDRNFKRNNLSVKHSYTKIINHEDGIKFTKKFSDLLKYDFNSVVFNFIDMLSHARSENKLFKNLIYDEVSFRSVAKSWLKNSPLSALLKFLSTKDVKVFLTTDHGTLRVEKPVLVKGNKETNNNLRFKFGKNINTKEKKLYVCDNGEKIKLPKGNIFSKYIFSSENQYLLYPKNFNYHSKNYKDTFQHGGISMEEIIIPFVELIPKYK